MMQKKVGKDHAECIQKSPYGTCKTRQQGFLTNGYRFVLRREAAAIAYAAGQIDEWEPDQTILSEEFWCPRGGGKHIYDEKKGYVLRTKEN